MTEQIQAPLIRSAEKPKKSGTVTVACKWPGGLHLKIQDVMEERVPTGIGGPDAYIMQRRNVPRATGVHVFGPSMPAMGGVPEGYVMPPSLDGGYALTPGVSAEFWEEWLEQNKQAPYVLNNIIFALPTMQDTKKKARELAEIKSGCEPLSREVDEKTGLLKDRRIPKPLNASVGRIAFDADRSAIE